MTIPSLFFGFQGDCANPGTKFNFCDTTGQQPTFPTGYTSSGGAGNTFIGDITSMSIRLFDNQGHTSQIVNLTAPYYPNAAGNNNLVFDISLFTGFPTTIQKNVLYTLRYTLQFGPNGSIATLVSNPGIILTCACVPDWKCERSETGGYTGYEFDANNCPITGPTHKRVSQNPTCPPIVPPPPPPPPPPVALIPKTVKCCKVELTDEEQIKYEFVSCIKPTMDEIFALAYRDEVFGKLCNHYDKMGDMNLLTEWVMLLFNDIYTDRTTHVEINWKNDNYWKEKYSVTCIIKAFYCKDINIKRCVDIVFNYFKVNVFGNIETPEPIFTIR